jgi:hypothetical protein
MPATPPLILKVAQFAPDLPDLTGQGSKNIRNVMPWTSMSYGPMPGLNPYSNPLGSRCQGAVAFIDSGHNVYIFAGDQTDLFQVKAGSTSWTNVSKTAGVYSCSADSQWHWTYFNGDVIATDYADNPQYFTLLTSSAFADLPGTPPKGRYIATVKNAFVVLGNTNDGVNGSLPQRVWWSAAGNAKASGWPTPGSAAAATVQSGATDLLGPAGWVQGIAPDLANADAAVFQEDTVKRMVYAGPPTVFDFLPAQNVQGTPAPDSIVVANGIAYYLAQDGFRGFDGAEVVPIGVDRIDRTFFGNGPDACDQNNIFRVVAASDPINRMIWWAYPGPANMGGNPNRLLGYNWAIDRWTICDISCETICKVLSIGYTLDELYTELGYSLDNLPAPLDSLLWTGGRLLLGAFDTSHQMNFFTGPNLAPRVDTQEIEPFPGQRTLITNTRPRIDGGVPSVSIGRRETLQAGVNYTAAVSINSLGACPVRASGRYIRGTMTEPAGSLFTNISGIELDGQPIGDR